MATVVLWLRNLLLVALAAIAIAAAALLPLTFFDGYSRHSIAKRYRPITDDEVRSIASAYPTPALLELADMPAEQRKGRIAALQHTTTFFEIGVGGVGLSRDTFPIHTSGPQYAADGAPLNTVVREVHVGGSGYPWMGVRRSIGSAGRGWGLAGHRAHHIHRLTGQRGIGRLSFRFPF